MLSDKRYSFKWLKVNSADMLSMSKADLIETF